MRENKSARFPERFALCAVLRRACRMRLLFSQNAQLSANNNKQYDKNTADCDGE